MPRPVSSLRPIIALILGSMSVVVCYFFVDRPVACFMHNHRFLPSEFLSRLRLVADWVSNLAIMGIIGVVAWRLARRGGPLQTLLLAIAASLLATEGLKDLLKWAFGRPSPESWIDGGPALTAPAACGFHPFAMANSYLSFPSGHAAATFAVISVLWLSRPRWRWVYAIVGGLMCMALVGLNYHFVGDVIAGAMLGSIAGYSATRLLRLRPAPAEQDQGG